MNLRSFPLLLCWSAAACLLAADSGAETARLQSGTARSSPDNPVSESRSLAGTWRFALDRQDVGTAERWFDRNLSGKVELPGSLPELGIGDPISTNTPWTGGIVDRSWFTAPEYAQYRQTGNVKVPFWLQPETYYAGVAWFQRDVEVPAGWQGKRVVLFLERPHWETRVWVDTKLVGTNNSLSTPHEYDLGQLAPGKHTLSIRVDNRRIVDIGENSHGITDHTQGNWNGIVGNILLRSRPAVCVDDLQVYPNLAQKRVRLRGHVSNATGQPGKGTVVIRVDQAIERGTLAPPPMKRVPVEWRADGGSFECDFPVSAPKPWDEFNPALYNADAWLEQHQTPLEGKVALFGFREIGSDGTQITINGRKAFIRGTLECCIFPKTGHPPTEIQEWRRIIGVAKSCGLNLLRFHSYCPPEAAFVAADEAGFYLQVETCWANQSTTIGDGKPVDQWVYDETDRIQKYYGNHPSFILMPHGNEPGGKNANAYLAKWVAHYKAIDPRRLWTAGSGWPQLSENQFHVTPDPRIQGWGQGLASRINAKPPETVTDYRDYIVARKVPVISHEIGQWCVYPNFDEMKKYTGYLKPRNFEIFRNTLKAHGMLDLARDFLLASGKLQTLCYKEDIESALRTPGMGGFELLDLHDFPGQGTALVGVLDPFWEEKGYVTAKEYSRFCNSTVPLARLKKRVFTTEETLPAEIEVAHFGPEPMKEAVTTWKLVTEDGKLLAAGKLPPQAVPIGNGRSLGTVAVDLKALKAPVACRLVVGLEAMGSARGPRAEAGGAPDSSVPSFRRAAENHPPAAGAPQVFENDWDIWVYPARSAPEPVKDILVTARFDDAAQAHLRSGGKLLLTIPGPQVRNFDTAPVKLGFSSIFWNTAWTGRQAPTTLGILCDPEHPALAEFPTEFHSNWQWWYLIHRAGALRLDLLPKDVEPIVRVIDDWFTARPLGLVVEGRVGQGKVLICGFDLTRDADDPVSRQMRTSLLDYMASEKFAPQTELSVDQVRSLIAAQN